MNSEINQDGTIITVTIPMRLGRRGGRKRIIAPDGLDSPPSLPPRDDTLIKLLIKAHRWLGMLETAKAPSIRAIAHDEKTDPSYVAKILRLTLLAPDIIKIIMDGNQPDMMIWRELSKPFPSEWPKQRERWGIS
jgi:hypothetical protein